MPYEIKQKNNKFYVIDTDTSKIRGTYDDEDDAEDRKDELDFRAHVRGRLERIPVAELTAEEKAAKYDEMIANKTDPNLPPKKPDPPLAPPKKSRYWNTANEN
jgi:hypothetical protein